MGIYEELGVTRIINAKGTYTVLGGSRMSRETLDAMADAASSFVDIRQLQRSLCDRIAEMTHNEAAYISNGAASGVYLSLAAAVALRLKKRMRYVTPEDFRAAEVIVFRSHFSPYSFVFPQLGVRVVELGFSNHPDEVTAEDIRNAVNQRTAAIYYLESGWISSGAPSLETVHAAAESCGIPVVLDAAAMLPPVENLWRYNERGATVSVFSGGKDLHGPQSSGLVLGSRELIDIILEFGFPTPGLGRMMKVGREEMAGLYSALKQFLAMDHAGAAQEAERQVERARALLSGSALFSAARSYPNEAGQPIARVKLSILSGDVSVPQVLDFLAAGEPCVIAGADVHGERAFYFNPMSMTMEEMELSCKKLLTFAP